MELEINIEDLLNKRRIESDRIEFKASWNPDDISIPMRDIEAGERFSTRYYRNKRLGEFLKELDLPEGKCTGIPTIQEELRNNGSPAARFYTDEDRRAVTVEIPIHPDFLGMDEVLSIDGEKSCVSDSNATFEYGESVDLEKKVSFGDKRSIDSPVKVSFEHEKSIVSVEKVSFEEMLKTIELTERTRENISLLSRALTDDVFGRSDVAKLLRLSKPGAGKLIKK